MSRTDADLLAPRYRIERTHAGAMGRLHVAEDTETGERLAIKTVREGGATEEITRRFHVEARAWMALGRHPHVVEARFFREIEGRPFLFLELVEGADLERVLGCTGGLPIHQAVELARHLFAGLAHGHAAELRPGSAGLVHRDLKPANLLLGRDRHLKVSDWGLVKVLGATAYTMEGHMVGTPAYAAPEQVRGASSVDARADLYAGGAVLFEMLANRPPFRGDNLAAILRAVLLDPAPRLEELVPDCPSDLAGLVGSLLEKEPELRPSSAQAVLQRLRALQYEDTTLSPGVCSTCGLATRAVIAVCPICQPMGNGQPTSAQAVHDVALPLQSQRGGSSKHGMVVVEGGAFRFGATRRTEQEPTFMIDISPVTNDEFREFMQSSGYRPADTRDFLRHWRHGRLPPTLADHPVVWVNYADAEAYARWAGKRLPSWRQWEKAARGPDGWRFPWGEVFDMERSNTLECRSGGTTPVRRYVHGASPCGCLDMAGNVQNWTSTWHEPELRRTKVVCGGSWAAALQPHGLARVQNLFPDMRDFQTGFRCVIGEGA